MNSPRPLAFVLQLEQVVVRIAPAGARAFILVVLFGQALAACKKGEETDQFTRLTNLGKSQLEQGNGAKAVEFFQQALQLKPSAIEAHLNLANAHLLASQTAEAIRAAGEALRLDANSPAAYYITGCAWLRTGDATNALQSLAQSQKLDQAVTALNFQLGLAHELLGHAEEALAEFQTVIRFEPEHSAAHYRLSQLLLRMGRQQEAAEELKAHQAILATKPGQPSDIAVFEKCKHTVAKLPFKLEQPAAVGITVVFTDATKSTLPDASRYRGPLGVIDLAHDGRNSLFAREGESFRLLRNNGAAFVPGDALLPGLPGANYRACLVGDLQNDRTEDAVERGLFGVPTFIVDGELYFGKDRLQFVEMAAAS